VSAKKPAKKSKAPSGILLVGCGKMGGALLAGWKKRPNAEIIAVIEPMAVATPKGVKRYGAITALPKNFSPAVVVFAVKPQSLADALPAYLRYADKAVFLSIAAGKTLRFFARQLGNDAAVVRTMPNTPAAIGRGITVACANGGVTAAQKKLCGRLLKAAGEVAWIDDEALLDPVTAVSGSGPAYVFLLIEALAEAGIAAGLPRDLALRLARATVAGSGELARQSSDEASQLRKNVTSPGGTTEAALKVLMADNGLEALMRRAIAAATARSRELAD
jgi:pyrroline-5-carboxylate reductase